MATRKYSAEGDPTWAGLGVTDPGTLAKITLSARRDRRVAATIAAGLYDNVIVFFDRLRDPDPQNLPALEHDGPLLVNAYDQDPKVPNAVDAVIAKDALERLLRARY